MIDAPGTAGPLVSPPPVTGATLYQGSPRCPLPHPRGRSGPCNQKVMELALGFVTWVRRAIPGVLDACWDWPVGVHRCVRCERDLELHFVKAGRPRAFPAPPVDPDGMGGVILGGC